MLAIATATLNGESTRKLALGCLLPNDPYKFVFNTRKLLQHAVDLAEAIQPTGLCIDLCQLSFGRCYDARR